MCCSLVNNGFLSGKVKKLRIRDYFIHHADGSWEPRQPVEITGPMGKIGLSPGVRFSRGVLFMGIDIAKLCDEDAIL